MYIISKYQTFRLQFRFVFCSKACLNSKTKLCIQYMEIYVYNICMYEEILSLYFMTLYIIISEI